MDVSPYVKYFLWRLCTNTLPILPIRAILRFVLSYEESKEIVGKKWLPKDVK